MSGVSSKVLQKGDFDKKQKAKVIHGTVQAMTGAGRRRKWTVKWDDKPNTTTVSARSLRRASSEVDAAESDSSSSFTSELSTDSSSVEQEAPTEPSASQSASNLDPHGLHWEHVPEVSVDTFSQNRKKFRLKWSNDLPIENRTPVDYFLLLFPVAATANFMEFTNAELKDANQRTLTKHEFFKFFGLLYAMTIVDYPTRRDYWGNSTSKDLFPKPDFGKFGMGLNRFENILRYLRCAPPGSPDRWCHIRAFVDAFNANRVCTCDPSWRLCVDEKTSSFRPRKGAYLSDGPPTLTKILRKPKSVCLELKDCTDGESRVTLRLELQEGKIEMAKKEFCESYNSGTSILLRLTKPWFFSGRLIVGDSAFASVEAAVAIHSKGLEFTGLVKTASRKFPKKFLSEIVLPAKGDHAVCIANPNASTRLLAVAWNGGKKRKLLVSTCGVTKSSSQPAVRVKYRDQGDGTSAEVIRETPWPEVVANYFRVACASDVNNHYRQGSLAMEETWGTKTWWHRIMATVLGTIEVDAYLAYLCLDPHEKKLSHREFVEDIAHSLIFNRFEDGPQDEETRTRKRKIPGGDINVESVHTLELLSSALGDSSEKTSKRCQRTCRVCKRKCSFYCVECSQRKIGEIIGICGPASERGMECYMLHVRGSCTSDK